MRYVECEEKDVLELKQICSSIGWCCKAVKWPYNTNSNVYGFYIYKGK